MNVYSSRISRLGARCSILDTRCSTNDIISTAVDDSSHWTNCNHHLASPLNRMPLSGLDLPNLVDLIIYYDHHHPPPTSTIIIYHSFSSLMHRVSKERKYGGKQRWRKWREAMYPLAPNRNWRETRNFGYARGSYGLLRATLEWIHYD